MLTPGEALVSGALSENNPFVETISYSANGQAAKSIRAAVHRGTAGERRGKLDDRIVYAAEIIISRDATDGIETVSPRLDSVSMTAPEIGSGTHTFLVAGIIGVTAGAWRLGLRQ